MKSTRGDPDSTSLPPPPADPTPSKLTVAVLGLTIVASLLTLPAFLQSLSWSGQPGDPRQPAQWTLPLWEAAFVVGVLSLFLASLSRRREGKRGSRRGRKLATVTVWVAILGACAWTYTCLLALNASL